MAAEADRRLGDYVAAVAAGTPTPGGGSVAAVVGALAAALGEMVANLTIGHDLSPEAERQLVSARERLTILRGELLQAAARDEAAYAGYRDAAALPRAAEGQRAARREAVRLALIVATDAPLAVARAAAEIAAITITIAERGNRPLRTDAALSALLSHAALRGALLNVRGNAALLKDESRAAFYRAEADALEATVSVAVEKAFAIATRLTDVTGSG
jgi:formiminotetrahydrofolate cyclodeaminase